MHPNEQLLRKGYDAYASGDLSALAATWSKEIVWHISGTTPLAGDYKGTEKILGVLAEIVKLANGSFELEVKKLFADDTTGLALCRSKVTYAGEAFDVLTTHVHRIKDGEIIETSFLFDDAVRLNNAQQAAFDLVAAKA